jgi:hypothetical protein
MSTTPAGWSSDPYGRHEQRYFDGSSWTEHVSDNGVQSVDANLTAAPPAPVVVPPMTPAQPRYAAPVQQTPTIIVKHRSRWPWVVLAIFVLFGLGVVGCVALVGTAANEVAKSINAEQAKHAISQAQFDVVQLGTPKAAVLAGLGKQPEDTSSFSSAAGDVKVQSDCVYYWETGVTFGHYYQFCFNGAGNLESKNGA